jgi:sugar phosphate permease
VPWLTLLASRQLWLLSAVYFCYGFTVVIFLSLFPKYLSDARHFSLTQMGIGASLPLLAGFLGDLTGGIVSDHLVKSTGRLRYGRAVVSVIGFTLAAICVPLAALSTDAYTSVALFCGAVFGLELTVGVSWAITLDVGGGAAGSVSAFMNTWGNVGSALAIIVIGYIVKYAGWNPAFFVLGVAALLAALMMTKVDPTRRLNV